MEYNYFLDKNDEIEQYRGNLPHWHQDAKLQFATFHLADSLPQEVLKRFRCEKEEWLKTHPKPWDKQTEYEYHIKFAVKIDKWLDAGYGKCVLRQTQIADMVESAIFFFENRRYTVHDYVIMPNHVHVLVETLENHKIKAILHSWKSYTAHEINRITGEEGKVWIHESYDRMIRDKAHYNNTVEYIHKNVKRAGVRWMKK